jgi:manganese-dependent ADP-ribose/CDP-alcohol diphosphatase
VVIYSHFPVWPENVHNLWNAGEMVELIEAYPCVKAYINGHNHAGNYALKNGIHYLTLKGMVDTLQTSYAVMHVYDDRLEVRGFGREENRTLEIGK